ncbi:MAG: DUF2723 domain-containing protein [Gemmatimonadaceae bacterium]
MPDESLPKSRHVLGAPFLTFAVLMGVYLASLAPDITLWDAGEFQSAVATLGIPHPPGAPLYVLLARAWVMVLHGLPLPVAMNALSAMATASAGASVTWLFARWTKVPTVAIGAGLAGGLVYSVWQNATETEVYALSLLLGLLMVVVAEHARGHNGQHAALLAYLMGVAGPLHLDALLAAPAAVLLVVSGGSEPLPMRRLLIWAGPLLVSVGLGKAAGWMVVAGVVAGAAVVVLPLPGSRPERAREQLRYLLLIALGATSVLFMLLRAPHDPGINQGDPSTWSRLLDVITRAQYDVPGLLPRRAPLWLQLGNVLQYLEWQFAFGVDDGTRLSLVRTPIAVVFGVLAWVGARAHWQLDRRSARVWLLYILVGGLGAMLVLNLQAGPSIGWGILPADAGHEARERDYFFVVAFLGIAAWAAMGAWTFARRRAPRLGGHAAWLVAVALTVLNWRATNRRREPDASVSGTLADALLDSTPPNAVLLLAADNDSYSVWQAQYVRQRRTDVVPVTLSLLGADWYRRELQRRYGLLDEANSARWYSMDSATAAIATGARQTRRPLAVAMSIPASVRKAMGAQWRARGLVFVASSSSDNEPDAFTQALANRLGSGSPKGRDPTVRYIEALLGCPSATLRQRNGALPATDSLDSVCNF